ncbi:BlaI/MecI/CopY family transcriptional regulator [Dysosmobacter sp.]|uniref:BlaI/MecI/CopY family transcriptional regulator n=1 Tax=Dysosmobacter sp. TaxID=2591382 RepID=UPI002A8A2DEC|nr:BlaI/MecI/CopY family transcriptional regulator [Dysosmobacter sp.]MDY3280965.1 BlaI/MecI/CopY family transcriptional regulator [Dysosmobacter sp.]
MKVNLSDAEWKLMKPLWDRAPRTMMELTALVREDTGWSKSTVITMLSRLEAKGAVRHEEGLRAKQYYPLIRREEAARAETESFLSRVYGGSLGLMMSAMVDSHALTEEDIAQLSAILDKAKEDGR